MNQRIIEPAAVHRLLVRQKVQALSIGRDFATLKIGAETIQVDLSLATLSSVPNWLVLQKVTLTTPEGSFDLAGLSKDAVADVEAAIQEAHRRASGFAALSGQTDQVRATLSSWDALATRDAYLTTNETRRWRADAPSLTIPQDNDADLLDRLPAEDGQQLRRLIPIRQDSSKVSDRRNTAYALRQISDFKDFFDTVESSPLTDQQRQAIVHDEDNALVIAGAGTGKTSTVVGKVGFILKKRWAAPEEILLLAFTAKAAVEMRERIGRRLGADVKVRTFHGLGMEIIAQAQGKKPSLCAEAEDRAAKAQTLKNLINDLLAEDAFRKDLLAFHSSLRRGYKPVWEFKSQSDYIQYLLDVEPRALDGQLLKSYEECEIANLLFTHSIPFEYERAYEVDTATVDRRQYKPDFYLPDHGIYIEHWGVDRGGNAAPFMDREKYRAKMEWARALHAQHATKLVETFSWERQAGVLLASLEAKLRALNVTPRPISVKNALAILNEKGRIDPFVTMISTFLSLFKSAGYSVDELRLRAQRGGDAARTERFLRLFGRVHQGYEALLRGRGEIDFDDMITLACRLVADGK